MPVTTIREGSAYEVTINTFHLDRLVNTAFRSFSAVLRAAAYEVQALAKMTAPVDTGALANSIKVYADDEDGLSYKVGPSVHYAIYQEMGWTDLGGTYHPGKWYMTNALLTAAPRAYAAVRQVFGGSGGGGESGAGAGGLGQMGDKGNR